MTTDTSSVTTSGESVSSGLGFQANTEHNVSLKPNTVCNSIEDISSEQKLLCDQAGFVGPDHFLKKNNCKRQMYNYMKWNTFF